MLGSEFLTIEQYSSLLLMSALFSFKIVSPCTVLTLVSKLLCLVADRALVGDAYRLCGDGHSARGQVRGEQSCCEHDITVRLSHPRRQI